MAFCGKCGNQIDDNTKFCPQCGASRSESAKTSSPSEHREQAALSENQQSEAKTDLSAKLMALNDTADTSSMFDANDIMQNKAMAILAYFGPLVLIPILAAKNSPFARYHSNQGLILLIVCIIWSIVYSVINSIILAISWRLYFISGIIGLVSFVFLILAVIGIINAANGKAKELPFIGKFKILK